MRKISVEKRDEANVFLESEGDKLGNTYKWKRSNIDVRFWHQKNRPVQIHFW